MKGGKGGNCYTKLYTGKYLGEKGGLPFIEREKETKRKKGGEEKKFYKKVL